MDITGFGADRLRSNLKILSDGDLWLLFLYRHEECSAEFWEEVENRKAAGILTESSPFRGMNTSLAQRERRCSPTKAKVIELTPDEWEARKRQKMFRLISA